MKNDDFDAAYVAENAARAGAALEALADGPAQHAADVMSAAFERAGQSIEGALSRAARSGELSFSAMADAILRDLSRIATERFITGPIDNLVGQLAAGLPFFGARRRWTGPAGRCLSGRRTRA